MKRYEVGMDAIIRAMTVENMLGFNVPLTSQAVALNVIDRCTGRNDKGLDNFYKDLAHTQHIGLIEDAGKNLADFPLLRVSRNYIIDHPETVDPTIYKQFIS